MKNIVYLQTVNLKKLEEYKKILGRHRITVFAADINSSIGELFLNKNVLAVMSETSDLFSATQQCISNIQTVSYIDSTNNLYNQKINNKSLCDNELTYLMSVNNVTILYVVTKNNYNNKFQKKIYYSTISGYINENINSIYNSENVFGWDNIFVNSGIQMTYHDMRHKGIKLSGRDIVLAEFARDNLYYENKKDMKANPQHPTKTIDFSKKVFDFIKNDILFNNPHIERYGAKNSWINAINTGAFWQASSHRRENIYWNPSGNGGVPFTPKINKITGEADHIHEMEFLNHDLGHRWMCPDLIFEGCTDPFHLRVQLLWRMLSEALTLVNGNMFFTDTLKRSNIKYDFSRRKIYPLFQSLNYDFQNNHEAVKMLFYANVRFALRNDDSIYTLMGAGKEELKIYKEKYHSYFLEDYKWTYNNIKNMCLDKEKFKQWNSSVSPLSSLSEYTPNRMTISECIKKMSLHSNKDQLALSKLSQDDLIKTMFDFAYETNIKVVLFSPPIEINNDSSLKSGFMKYIIAQLYIFDVYDFVPESAGYRERIIKFTKNNICDINVEKITIIRNHYNDYVNILFNRKAITKEDCEMYKEIFPHFPPHYIYYDRIMPKNETLDVVSSNIWNDICL